MFRKLLVATDGSALSVRAVERAVALARDLGAGVVGFSAIEPYPYIGFGQLEPAQVGQVQAAAAAHANDALAALETAARAAGVDCETVPREVDPPWLGILQMAEDRGCDCIVMGSHGRRGVAAVLLGSQTQHVLARSRLPVLVVR